MNGEHRVVHEIDRVRGSGGRRLVVHRFACASRESVRASALLLHGIQSHAGWYSDTAHHLAGQGVEVYLPERRGSGIDLRDRGDCPSWRALLEDALAVSRHAGARSGQKPVWIGVSWGGKLAMLAAGLQPESMSALALVVPGIKVKVGLTARERARVALLALLGGRFRHPIPLADPSLWSEVPEHQSFVASDPLSLREATARFLVATWMIDQMLERDRSELAAHLDVMLVLAGDDRIVDNRATTSYLRERAGERVQRLVLTGARHTPDLSIEARRYREALARFCRGPASAQDAPVPEGESSPGDTA